MLLHPLDDVVVLGNDRPDSRCLRLESGATGAPQEGAHRRWHRDLKNIILNIFATSFRQSQAYVMRGSLKVIHVTKHFDQFRVEVDL